MATNKELITIEEAPTIAALFRQRVLRTPDATAYIQYSAVDKQWHEHSWQDTAREVSRWQQAMRESGLISGDRIAIMCANSWEWVICDQAALGLGMVLVPVYTNDRSDNIAWIIENSGAALLVLENQEQWEGLQTVEEKLGSLKKIVILNPVNTDSDRVISLSEWLPDSPTALAEEESAATELATIVYTSGTTGRPKGVMLSHHNILWNLHAGLKLFDIASDNLFLSFLPLSHSFERTVGYYLALVTGSTTAYNRSIPELADDLQIIKPTIMISVPRIFERIYGKITKKLESESAIKRKLFQAAIDVGWKKFEYDQGRAGWSAALLSYPILDKLVGEKVRARLGGRLRFTVCGGAALSPDVARLFIGLGIPVQQGYGLTETSPIIAANPLENNVPESVGIPLPGIEVKTGDNGELITRSPSVMLGYWNNPQATAEIIDSDGWLHTGDKVQIDAGNHILITGRLKEIIVLANGEKVPPTDMENAIVLDHLIEQAIVCGEGKPYLAALLVPNPDEFIRIAAGLHLDPEDPASYQDKRLQQLFLEHTQQQLNSFPGYAQVRRVAVLQEALTPDNGLLTPTLKLRRNRILLRYSDEVTELYAGH